MDRFAIPYHATVNSFSYNINKIALHCSGKNFQLSHNGVKIWVNLLDIFYMLPNVNVCI